MMATPVHCPEMGAPQAEAGRPDEASCRVSYDL